MLCLQAPAPTKHNTQIVWTASWPTFATSTIALLIRGLRSHLITLDARWRYSKSWHRFGAFQSGAFLGVSERAAVGPRTL